MKTIAFHNLGCKVNSYEQEIMRQLAEERGYRVVDFTQDADVYVINTCTVTNIADRKSRQMLHRAKQKNPNAVVVAVGCYVQTGIGTIEKDPCVDIAIGNNHKAQLMDILERYEAEHRQLIVRDAMEDLCGYETMRLSTATEHTRAYIKIQDGCNQFCSYCLIPYARGRVRSRGADDILEEVRNMVALGCLEVVLTGIHISSYGIDLDPEGWREGLQKRREGTEGADAPMIDYAGRSLLIELMEEICKVPGLKRLRVSSLEPRIITEENARRMAALPQLCPHFHLSLQSGCDTTLKAMNRHYTAAEYARSVGLLRRFFEAPAITTDVIVGFPGESEADFAESLRFLEETDFYMIHVFKYSRRKGTAADRRGEQVSAEDKSVRSDAVLALTAHQAKRFRETYVGRTAEVLWEENQVRGGILTRIGHTPDYIMVSLPASHATQPVGSIETVRIASLADDGVLVAEPE
jgi:threonylcarbamoyladenosine tRNA methylthiotransferase MtaB